MARRSRYSAGRAGQPAEEEEEDKEPSLFVFIGYCRGDTTSPAAACVEESDHLTLVNAGDEEVVSQEGGEKGGAAGGEGGGPGCSKT